MRKLLISLAILFESAGGAYAQAAPTYSNVVATCGTPNGSAYVAGTNRPNTQDTGGKACSNVSATVTGTVTADQGTAASQTVSNAWPTIVPDSTATGTITTENLNSGGTATAGSAVTISLQDTGTVTIQVTGTYTGALSPQVTTDGTNWVTQTSSSALQNMADGSFSSTIGSGDTGIWQIEVNGHAQFRITALGAVTGTANITLRGAAGTAQVSIGGVTVIPSGTQDTNLKQVNGVTTSTGAGAVGTGSQRVSVGQDTTTIAGSAPGTTASPSSDVLSAVSLPSAASTAGNASVQSSSVETGHVIKAGAGNLYSFNVSVDSTLSASAWAVMIFNSTTVPAAGAVTPIKCYLAPIGTTSINGAFPTPLYLSTGISMAVSSGQTCFTKTDSAHGFISANAQ